MKKFIFFVIWLVLLALVPVTLMDTTPLPLALHLPIMTSSLILRFLGLTAFILLFVEIILGAFMDRISMIFGGWVFNFHQLQGKFVYLLALIHPIFFIILNHFVKSGFDPYAAFINICMICSTKRELYISFGRIGFWLLTITVFAAIFRSSNTWLKTNWRKLHVVNYIIFLIIGAHGFLVGSDFTTQPFYGFAILAYAIIVGIIVFIELPRLYKSFRGWVRS